jgi:zinc protease
VRRACVAALLLAVACAPPRLVAPLRYEGGAVTTVEDDALRTPPPRPPVDEVVDPAPAEWSLSNGMRVLLVERHDFPTVAARLFIDRGPLDLGDAGAVQVSQTAYLYGRGGSEAAFEQLAEDLTHAGATITGGVHRSAVWGEVRAPTETLDAALDALRRASLDAHLTTEEYDRRAAEWRQAASSGPVSILAAERLVLFGSDQPYGYAGAGREVLPMTMARAIHGRLFQPWHATLLVVGDVTREGLAATVERTFGTWAIGAPLPKQDAPPALRPFPRMSMLSHRGLTQVHAAVFARGPAPASDDTFAFFVAAHLLAGGPSSRLFERLRDETGAAYSVGAFTYAERNASWMSLAASYDYDKAIDGVGEVLLAVRDLRAGKVSDEQIDVAREGAIAAWRKAMATNEGALSLYAASLEQGLGTGWVRGFPARVAAIGRDDLARVATRYLGESSIRVLFLGDDRWLDAGPLGMGDPAALVWPR